MHGDVRVVTYVGAQPGDAPVGPAAASAPEQSVVVPQRRVPKERLRGRDGLVDALTGAVTRRAGGDATVPGVWLLSGMGGSGKTTVALEVAHRLREGLTHVWWVSGADREGKPMDLRALALAAGATPGDLIPGADHAYVLWQRLNALTTPWLLVLDNIDDLSLLTQDRPAEGTGWLQPPSHPTGTVLLTSRETRGERWGNWVHTVHIDLLSGADGAQVLRDLAPGAGTEEQARELAEHLGGLPLALDLAGSYLRGARRDRVPEASSPRTFPAYRSRFDRQMADLAFDPDAALGDDERPRRALLTTWELSLDLLHRQGADMARPLLRLLSAFGPAPIPYLDLLDVDLLARDPMFTGLTTQRFRAALDGLEGLKLITFPEEPETAADQDNTHWLTIHAMVRAASRAHDDFRARARPLLGLVTALLDRATGSLWGSRPADWPRWGLLAPHGPAARLLLTEFEESIGPALDLVTAATEPAVGTARYHRNVGLHRESVAELQAVVRTRARLLGEEARATLVARLDLALALRDHGDLEESEELYRLLVVQGGNSLPADDPVLSSFHTGLARTLLLSGRYEDARRELDRALELRTRTPAQGQRGMLRIRADLARLAHRQGRFAEAVEELSVVRRLTRALGQEAVYETLAAGLSLARVLRDAGRAREAEAVAEEVIQELRDAMGEDHPDVLIARHERARMMRDHEEDRELLERARDEFTEIWRSAERQLGVDHPDTIAARHELATVWHLLDRRDRAVEHFRAAYETGRRRLGEHHPNIVVCARNLALVLAELAEDSARPPGEAAPADVSGQSPDPPASTPLALAGLSLELALSPQFAPAVRSPAVVRALDRFVRSERSVSDFGGEGGGAGVSSGAEWSNYRPGAQPPPRRTYRPPTEPVVARERSARGAAVDGATLRALARGDDDRQSAERLRAQERGIRLLALRDLLDRTESAMAGRMDRLPSVPKSRDLLLQADDARSKAVTTVLLHPAVGRWMSRTLRALHTSPIELSDALLDDLAHLHSVAAAASHRAKVPFALSLPVRDGFVVLPTLGAFDLRGTRLRTVRVEGDGGTLTLARRGGESVRVTRPEDPTLSLWRPVHRVRTGSGPGRFDFVLDDIDQHRETNGPMAPTPLTGSQVMPWAEAAREAGALLARTNRRRAEALAAALTAVTPRPAAPGGIINSASSTDAFGGIVASAPPDGMELAASMVHEFQHMKLHAVLNAVALHEESEPPDDERFYAPWRDDPRPLPGLFQGVFAFFGVVDFWRRLTLEERGTRLRRAQFQLVYWRTQARDAYSTLCLSPRLTETGRYFAALMGGTTVTWTDHEDVPEDIVTLALEGVVAHRLRWRLRHLRPAPATVAELAAAWTSGAPKAPPRGSAVTLRPDFTARPSNAYTALLCKAATGVSELRGVPVSSGFLDLSGAEIDPADLTRLQDSVAEARRLAVAQVEGWPLEPEPWVRLGLALRRSGAVAAEALTHCPELVRAVHACVTEASDAPPDPVDLAAWIGVPDDPDGYPRPPAA
ncbi:HEXXH motif-containing putative peptide modification protein [Streptomyces cinnabarinus]|uniref:HEXXH motif-containing putative peptide modification protein n=1 Tax=Streptomyces cinnabarinus TaxID=67287 RepID=A0ABY7KQ39_9ACTN|nr:HEXXH motif-containing putative peptide modification protein [Streptomyces cinnabarinus]WAZ25512.1 HEXXH motif-containing putative peptide modification protein [Streptomyces cinnabarinus]